MSDHLRLNFGLRYEMDTEVNNQSRFDELNPIVLPFVDGERERDLNNVAPRVGFAWSLPTASRLTIRGGYGIYYDRIVLEVQSLERGLDGRSLPIEVRAGNVLFLDPATGRFPPFAPTLSNPFTGFILPGAGASGINIIDSHLQSPKVQQFHLGAEWVFPRLRVRVDGLHDDGSDFLIGRTVGEVFNPVVGGPDRVVNIESSARTKYDALLVSMEHDGLALHAEHRLHAVEGLQLRQRRSDPVPRRSRSIPTIWRARTGPRPTTAVTVSSSPGSTACQAASTCRACGRCRRRCRWTS